MNIIKNKDFKEFIARQQSQSIRPSSDFVEDAMDRLENGVTAFGDPLPWQKTHDDFRFREGEVTIWAGVNGSGKSLVMRQTTMEFANETKVLIASMEMLGSATVARMMRQASGVSQPNRSFADRFVERTSDSVWIYDQVGTVKPDQILGMIHWSAEKLGVKHIMIDSLVKCGVDQEKNSPQRDFVDSLCSAAKEHKVHVHLVVHIRKPAQHGEFKMPTKFDIKGAGEITDLADNVLIISRNGKKEYMKMKGDSGFNPQSPDGYILCAKQRHGEWDGIWTFWWHEKSQQWISQQGAGAMPYPTANDRL